MAPEEHLQRLLDVCESYTDGQAVLLDRLAVTGGHGEAVATGLRAHLDQLDAAVREAHLVLVELRRDATGSARR